MDKVLFILLLGSCAVAQQTMILSGIVRDQAPAVFAQKTSCSGYGGTAGTANGGLGFNGTDFEIPLNSYVMAEKGLVGAQCNASNWQTCGTLGTDNTPMYAYPGISPGASVQSPASFYTWFHDSPQTVNVPINLTLTQVGQSVYSYSNMSFFPIDGKGWNDHCYGPVGAPWTNHNFAFCIEIHSRFQYQGGEVFEFMGDDDVWVYINRKLVVDLGGLHPQMAASLNLDTIPNLVKGNVYPFDFFYCERHTTQSDIQISTSLSFYCAYYDWCGVCEGNGQSCCTAQQCDDNNTCTADSCSVLTPPQSGGCVHTPVNCSVSHNACQQVGCDPSTGCYVQAISCDDGNACTVDTCSPTSGCQHTPKSCDDGDQCTTDTCSPATGCKSTLISCDDANACTTDTCNATIGCAHTAIQCDDGNKCTIDTCSPATGCKSTLISCDDANACTTDTCSPATGCKSTLISCDDANACTIDTCNRTTGCAHALLSCDDGNKCTTDSCDPVTGCKATPISCDDANACTIDTCNRTTGCEHAPLSCDDGSKCTTDSCDPATGCKSTPISCDDANECTTDICNTTAGCTHALLSCDDGNKCTTDSCAPATGCTSTPISCDDGNECTVDACNPTTACAHTPLSCDDGNACTSDSCAPATGCTTTPISCDDGNACTADACDPISGCAHAPIACDDTNKCTTDSCDPLRGCTHTNVTCAAVGVSTCGAAFCDPTTGCQYSTDSGATWVNNLLTSWVDPTGLHTQWNAVLHTGDVPLYSVTFDISPEVYGIWNVNLTENGLYELPIWQYQDGRIPAHSSYVSFGYNITGPRPANITLSTEICAPENTGCKVNVTNLLVNSWVDGATGFTIGQYNLLVNNIGSRVVAHVNVTITPPSGNMFGAWNLIPGNGEFECQLWNLFPGKSSQVCGFNVNYTTSAPGFSVTNVTPLCI